MPFELDRNTLGIQFNLLFKTVRERLLGFRFTLKDTKGLAGR